MDSFIDLFQLREDSGKEHHQPTSLNDGLKILKGTADFMKEIEVQARARTGRNAHKDLILGLRNQPETLFKCYTRHLSRSSQF